MLWHVYAKRAHDAVENTTDRKPLPIADSTPKTTRYVEKVPPITDPQIKHDSIEKPHRSLGPLVIGVRMIDLICGQCPPALRYAAVAPPPPHLLNTVSQKSTHRQ